MNTRPLVIDEIIYEVREALNATLTKLEGATKNCLNCRHFDEAKELCNKFQQRPPARVIALACQHHEDSYDIPF